MSQLAKYLDNQFAKDVEEMTNMNKLMLSKEQDQALKALKESEEPLALFQYRKGQGLNDNCLTGFRMDEIAYLLYTPDAYQIVDPSKARYFDGRQVDTQTITYTCPGCEEPIVKSYVVVGGPQVIGYNPANFHIEQVNNEKFHCEECNKNYHAYLTVNEIVFGVDGGNDNE